MKPNPLQNIITALSNEFRAAGFQTTDGYCVKRRLPGLTQSISLQPTICREFVVNVSWTYTCCPYMDENTMDFSERMGSLGPSDSRKPQLSYKNADVARSTKRVIAFVRDDALPFLQKYRSIRAIVREHETSPEKHFFGGDFANYNLGYCYLLLKNKRLARECLDRFVHECCDDTETVPEVSAAMKTLKALGGCLSVLVESRRRIQRALPKWNVYMTRMESYSYVSAVKPLPLARTTTLGMGGTVLWLLQRDGRFFVTKGIVGDSGPLDCSIADLDSLQRAERFLIKMARHSK